MEINPNKEEKLEIEIEEEEDEAELKKMKPAGEFQLYCEIISCTLSENSPKDLDAIFQIDFYSYLSKKSWTIFRKLSDFSQYTTLMDKFYVNVPKLPSKINQTTKQISDLNNKKFVFENYLQTIVNRPDLISNVYTIKFLQLDNHFPDFSIFQPLQLYNIEEMENEIIGIDYNSNTSLLFVACVNKNFTAKISSYFSKIKLFGSNSNQENEKGISQLIVYNIIKNNSGESHFEPLFTKNFQSEICYIKFYEKKDTNSNNLLVLGFANGNIEIFKVFVNEGSNIARELMENMCTLKVHKKPITGVAINFTIGYVYSVARECNMSISELNYQSLMRNIPISKKEITNSFYDEDRLKFYLADESGSIWIVDLMHSLQPQVIQAFHTRTPYISSLDFDVDNRYLFLGNKNGTLQVFELIEDEKDKMLLTKKFELNLDPSLKITGVKFTLRNEILISLSNGSIAVYSHEEENPEFVIDAHLQEIPNFIWDEKKKILISASLDKGIKMWQLPLAWPSELVRKFKQKNERKILLKNSKEQRKFFKENEDEKHEEEKTEKISEIFEMKNFNENESDKEENFNSKLDSEFEIEKNYEIVEDEDFIIGQKLKKMNELTEKEINCEDLHGWDEDPQF